MRYWVKTKKVDAMIVKVVAKGRHVVPYNECNRSLWDEVGDLVGWTSSVVEVKLGNDIKVFDENHRLITSRTAW